MKGCLTLLLTTHILLSPNTAIADDGTKPNWQLVLRRLMVSGNQKLDVPPFTIVISDDYKNIKMQRHDRAQEAKVYLPRQMCVSKDVCR